MGTSFDTKSWVLKRGTCVEVNTIYQYQYTVQLLTVASLPVKNQTCISLSLLSQREANHMLMLIYGWCNCRSPTKTPESISLAKSTICLYPLIDWLSKFLRSQGQTDSSGLRNFPDGSTCGAKNCDCPLTTNRIPQDALYQGTMTKLQVSLCISSQHWSGNKNSHHPV